MPRHVRIQYPGAVYHVMSRGNRRQNIYLDDVDLEVAQAKAKRIILEELRRLRWQEADLAHGRKRDPAKLEIALRRRQETTPSVKQTAVRHHLGTPGRASVCLLASMRKTGAPSTTQGYLGI